MNIAKLSAELDHLPEGELLVRVAQYQESIDDFVSPGIEFIDNGAEASLGWFADDEEAAVSFSPFASTHDGSLFGYWRLPHRNETRIVYLGSECVGTRVIANSVSEFLSLLAFGSDDFPIDIEYTDQDEEWEGPEDVPDSLHGFRTWLASELGITAAASPLATIKSAMSESPDLMAWVREWQDCTLDMGVR